MKIEKKMIDKQLRIPAKIFKVVMNPISEEDFKRFNAISRKLRKKSYKGLNIARSL